MSTSLPTFAELIEALQHSSSVETPADPPFLIQPMKSELYSQQRHFLFTKEQAHTKNLEENSGGRLSQADLVSHKGSCSSETPEY